MLLLFCSTYFLVNGKSCTKVKAVAFIRRLYSKIEKDVGYKALQKYYDKWSIRPLKQTVRDAISSHNLREVFRQQLKVDGIDTVFRITPAGRIYGVTFIDHSAGMSANGLVLGKEFSTNIFNKPIRRRRKRSGMLRNSIRSRSMRREAIKSIRSLESSTSYWIWPIPQAYEERERRFCGGKDEEGASKIYRSSRKRGESDGNFFRRCLRENYQLFIYFTLPPARER